MGFTHHYPPVQLSHELDLFGIRLPRYAGIVSLPFLFDGLLLVDVIVCGDGVDVVDVALVGRALGVHCGRGRRGRSTGFDWLVGRHTLRQCLELGAMKKGVPLEQRDSMRG